METTISNYPLIYYIVKGKSANENNNFFEKEFLDLNPMIARKKAFDYFEYNVHLPNQSKIAASDENLETIKSEFILDKHNKFSVAINEQISENIGVGLYLVINNTIGFANKTEQSEERLLIHVEDYSEPETITEMKKSLVREFSLYKYLDFLTDKNGRIIESYYSLLPDNQYNQFDNSIILKTPFDFKTFDFNTSRKNVFDRKIVYVLNNIFHRTSSFINDLDWHNIRIQMSSFLNTGSGYIFLGNIKNTSIITSVFEGKTITEIRTELDENISKYFPKHSRFFSFEFVTINNALIVIIVFKTFVTPCFYDNETNNNFYFRGKNGINVMNITAMIVSYVNIQTARHKDSIQEIIDAL